MVVGRMKRVCFSLFVDGADQGLEKTTGSDIAKEKMQVRDEEKNSDEEEEKKPQIQSYC